MTRSLWEGRQLIGTDVLKVLLEHSDDPAEEFEPCKGQISGIARVSSLVQRTEVWLDEPRKKATILTMSNTLATELITSCEFRGMKSVSPRWRHTPTSTSICELKSMRFHPKSPLATSRIATPHENLRKAVRIWAQC